MQTTRIGDPILIARTARQYGPGKGAKSANQVPTAYPLSKQSQIERIKRRLARPTKHRPGSAAKLKLVTLRSYFGVPMFMPGDYCGPQVSHAGVERDANPMEQVVFVGTWDNDGDEEEF